ncbi:MAG: hypothetical protein ABII00_18320 [Elusimicrobiota bacterium]
MVLPITCRCGKRYALKDEWLDRLVECPLCGGVTRVEKAVRPQAIGVFDRDIFLLRQRRLLISDKYRVCDETGATLLYVERPLPGRNVGAFLTAVVSALLVLGLMPLLGRIFDPPAFVAGPLAIGVVWLAYYLPSRGLSMRRHISIYSDETRRERLLWIRQDTLFDYPEMRFSLMDPSGRVLCVFIRSFVNSLFRKYWQCKLSDGTDLLEAKEDSVILSLMRRWTGYLFVFLRTDFILLAPHAGTVLGEFNRKTAILDHYVLDLTSDPDRTVDRRIAVALGILLDAGERR